MNKWMLAPITLLLSGAVVLPAVAQEPGQEGAARSAQGEYARESGGEPRSDEIRGNGGNRQNRERGGDRDGRESGPQEGRSGRGEPGYSNAQPGPQNATRSNRVPAVAAPAYAAQNNGRGNDARYDSRRQERYQDRAEVRYDNRYDRRDDRRYDNRYDRRDDRRYDNRDRNRYVRYDDRRWRGNYWYPQYRYRAPVRYVHPYGYRPYQWRVGHRLPSSYYRPNYYVDYRGYQLPPPPYGYNWVRVDRDVVLVSLASGLIQDILYGLYY